MARLNCDVAALVRLMADEAVQINSVGRVVSKAEVIASFDSSERHWDETHSNDFRVRVYDETTVVIGPWQARGVNTGQTFEYSAHYLSVWIWRDGRWQMTVDQSTDIT